MTSAKPASVFAFQVGEIPVTCMARRLSRLEAILKKPGRSQVLRDEKYEVGGQRARHLVYELEPSAFAGTKEPSRLALYVIQTQHAFYVFLYRYRRTLNKAADRAVRQTVDSFTTQAASPLGGNEGG